MLGRCVCVDPGGEKASRCSRTQVQTALETKLLPACWLLQVFGNSYGVLAAAQLADAATTDADREKYAMYMRHFLNSLLRDTPWSSDRTDDATRSFDGAGAAGGKPEALLRCCWPIIAATRACPDDVIDSSFVCVPCPQSTCQCYSLRNHNRLCRRVCIPGTCQGCSAPMSARSSLSHGKATSRRPGSRRRSAAATSRRRHARCCCASRRCTA